jgi:hypothetical protein
MLIYYDHHNRRYFHCYPNHHLLSPHDDIHTYLNRSKLKHIQHQVIMIILAYKTISHHCPNCHHPYYY